MRVVIRVDAASHIGSGHLMRLSNVSKGCEVLSIIRQHEKVRDYYVLRYAGFDYQFLTSSADNNLANVVAGPPHVAWLGIQSSTDAQQTLLAIQRVWSHVHWVVVDHYGIDASWEHQICEVTEHVLVIDDLAERRHDCDVLLNKNLGWHRENYKNLGPKMAA